MILPDPLSVQALYKWYSIKGISYPWGKTRDPYPIWISEIMLQQTVITAVLPFYGRWMVRFPELATLADAEEEEVYRLWEGLGYYSRAANILKTARILVRERGGVWPVRREELVRLPGIGPYTAAAIASFAFKADTLVLDANVKRILCRLNGFLAWPPRAEQDFRDRIAGVLAKGEYGLWNGALMQLGQLVCRSRKPLCGECPFQGFCQGFLSNQPELYPSPRNREIKTLVTERVVVYSKGSFLMEKREEGIGRGLWVFPKKEQVENWFSDDEGILLGQSTHSYTDHKEQIHTTLYAIADKRELSLSGLHWIGQQDLERLPMPPVYRKIAEKATLVIERTESLAK